MNSVFRNVALLSAGQGLSGSVLSLMTSVSPLIGADMTPDRRLATLPVTATILGAAVMMYPTSIIMDRVGRRNGFLLSVVLGVSGGAAGCWAIAGHAFWAFVMATFVIGMSTASNQYYRFAAADLGTTPSLKAKAISIVMSGGVIGGFLGPALARLSTVVAPSSRFGAALIALIFVYVIVALVLAFLELPRAASAGGRTSGTRSAGQIVRSPTFVSATLSCLIGFSAMTLLMNATPLAMSLCGLGFAATTSVLQWHFVAMYLPAFVTGMAISRWGSSRVLLAGYALFAVGIAAAALGTSVVDFLVALVLFGFGWSLTYATGTALLATSQPAADKAKAQGLNSLIVYAGNLGASLCAGEIMGLGGWATVNAAAVPLLLVGAGTALYVKRMEDGARRASSTLTVAIEGEI